jgi:hypothetical protein
LQAMLRRKQRAIGIPLSAIFRSVDQELAPPEIRSLVWFGYGAGGTQYHTPLWPSMEGFRNSIKTEADTRFQKRTLVVTSTYVQEMT